MLDNFIKHIGKNIQLNEEDIELLHAVLQIKHFKKKEFLLREGEISKAFFFNLQGLIRLFYLNDGEEKTAYFYPEKTFVSAYSSFVNQKPASLNLQAATEVVVVEISIAASEKLLHYSGKFDVMARIAMEEELINHQAIIASLLCLKPADRYLHLLNANPTLFQQIPQRFIASYLGVKPESLSRIKKRIFDKKS